MEIKRDRRKERREKKSQLMLCVIFSSKDRAEKKEGSEEIGDEAQSQSRYLCDPRILFDKKRMLKRKNR